MAYIIAEIHGQYGGNLGVAEQMILQAKFGGANAVKFQLYDSMKLDNNHNGDFLSLSFDELKSLSEYAKMLRIDCHSSFFDEERMNWCLELGFSKLKIANTVFTRMPELTEKAIATGKEVWISMKAEQVKEGKPYDAPNVHYLYTEPIYPAMLEEINMPDFRNSFLEGYSDHTIGITASTWALAHGAKVIEKHFTIAHSWQKTKEKAQACSMNVDQLRQLREFARGFDLLENKNLFQYETK